MHRILRIVLGSALVIGFAGGPLNASSGGSGSGSSGGNGSWSAKPTDPLARALELTKAKDFPAAIEELRRVDATGDPMWNNLMGYSLRESSPPDFAAAEGFYAAALKIDPKHRPTLEYLGELRLQQGNLAGAEQELAALKQATWFKSSEYKELEKAIARFKANGNKFVDADD